MMPNIELSYDKIVIEGVVILRPSRISPSEWLEYWERLYQQTKGDKH